MTDESAADRPTHPSADASTEGAPTADAAGERYGPSGQDDEDAGTASDVTAVAEGFFDRIPEGVVSLGAGSLATSTLLTLAVTGFVYYSLVTAQWYGYQPYQMVLAAIQFTFAALMQVTAVYYARKRMRWFWVMLGALAGVLSIVGLPFAVLAVLCLGLGKNHFASHTPLERIRSGAED